VYNVVSGNTLFVENGVAITGYTEEFHLLQHPRTAALLDESGSTLMLMVVDGRQAGYSEGVSIPELAEIALEFGAHTALNLDGGGSSALVVEGADGQPIVLNSPIDQNIPGRERVVANHLGVYVRGTE
jgi:exopolysaccharide biosynthesis protein